MEQETFVAEVVDDVNEDDCIKLDASVKRFFALKAVLARILKECVEEYADVPVEDIEKKYIEGTPSIGKELVDEDAYMPMITGSNTEHTTKHERKSTFDVKFNALVPNGQGDYLQLIVNVEAQGSDEYSLIKRGFYYCGRMLSAQNGRCFVSPHYNKLRKVISIWICFSGNAVKANTLNCYRVEEKRLAGGYHAMHDEYAMVDVVVLYIGDDKSTNNKLLKMLDTMFSKDYNVEEKKKYLEDNCGIAMTEKVAEEVSGVCNYSEYIKERGVKLGEITTVFNFVLDGTISLQTGAQKLKTSVEAFTKALDSYKATGEVSLNIN